MPRKKKHPMRMTDEEALKHLFHPKIVKEMKKHLKPRASEHERSKSRKGV
jgi:hypothetical protein